MFFDIALTMAASAMLALAPAAGDEVSDHTGQTAALEPVGGLEASVLELPDLSSGQFSADALDTLLSSTGNVPDNCWVRYFGQTSICMEVICVEGGVWVPYECWEFGL